MSEQSQGQVVCQLNEAGYFMGITIADESPLEPGVFLIPRLCIEVAAPTIPEGKRARWVDDDWVFEDLDTTPDVDPTTTVEWQIAQKQGEIKNLLLSVGCVNETHMQKDILLMQGFGAFQGFDHAALMQANPTYATMNTIAMQIAVLKTEIAALQQGD